MTAAVQIGVRIAPQAGKQEQFLACAADVAIYGGAAGGGKTYALLLEPLRHVMRPDFAFVIFRRTTPQIRNAGGLWDTSAQVYPYLGAESHESVLEWQFPSGARGKFAHLEHEKNKLDWQGAQIAYIGFDELTHFTRSQFFYLLSRNRSTSGVRPYVRATCNPDPDSWVADFIAWWIDPDSGFPIPERSGVLRYFFRDGDAIVWGDSPAELHARYPHAVAPPDIVVDGIFEQRAVPKSATFIAAKLTDNPILMTSDPGYLANLQALARVEREQLLGGNWKIRASAGLYFKRDYFGVVEVAPAAARSRVRYWDLAATEQRGDDDPDWTAGARLSVDAQGIVYIEDVRRVRATPANVERLVRVTAEQDGMAVGIGIEEEPGASGKTVVDNYIRRVLPGFNVRGNRVTGDKVLRAGPLSAQCEAGNVRIVRGAWNDAFLAEAENFPPGEGGGHDDQVDAAAGAYLQLVNAHVSGSLEMML